jgi:predicted nucleic acid-binding protein
MSRYLIDTDWIIDALNNQTAALDRLTSLAPEGLAVSLISYGELWEGAKFARDPARELGGLATFLQGK